MQEDAPPPGCYRELSILTAILSLPTSRLVCVFFFIANILQRLNFPTMASEDPPSPEPKIIHSSGEHAGPPELRLLHYNDVYHVDGEQNETTASDRMPTAANGVQHLQLNL